MPNVVFTPQVRALTASTHSNFHQRSSHSYSTTFIHVTPVLLSVHSSTVCVFYIECVPHMNFCQLRYTPHSKHTPQFTRTFHYIIVVHLHPYIHTPCTLHPYCQVYIIRLMRTSYNKHTLQFPSLFPCIFPTPMRICQRHTGHTRSTLADVVGTPSSVVDGRARTQHLLVPK